MTPEELHILYSRILADVIQSCQTLSGAAGLNSATLLERVPNLVVDPTLRRLINLKWFSDGGGFPPGSVKNSWSCAYYSRTILYRLTGQ